MRLPLVTTLFFACSVPPDDAVPADPAWSLGVRAADDRAHSGDTVSDDSGHDSGQDSGGDSGDSGGDSGDSADTGFPVDTGDTSPLDTGDTGKDPGDTGKDTADTGSGTGDTAAPDSGADSGTPDTGDSTTGCPCDTGDTSSTDTSSTDTGRVDTGGSSKGDTGAVDTAPVVTDTAVYTPEPCDSADTGGCNDVVRFVAIGDAGTGDARQERVAEAIEDICFLYGCDFALYLGDNFYGAGVENVADPLWTSHFEIPYAGLGFRFMAVLGNHDYGGYYDTGRAAAQVAYTAYSTKWYMPTRYYTEIEDDLTVIGLDSQSLQLGYGSDQEAWIPTAIASLSTTWSVAIGHHPYISNGPHGNAGEFDGRAGEGEAMKDFFDAYICGNVDLYLAGHDHTLQWLEPQCGTEFLVAGGGGAGTYPLVGTNDSYFEASDNGFLWVEINGRDLTGVFYDDTGAELYRQTITK